MGNFEKKKTTSTTAVVSAVVLLVAVVLVLVAVFGPTRAPGRPDTNVSAGLQGTETAAPAQTEPDVTSGQTEPTMPRETEPEKPAETEPDVTTGQTEPTMPRETEPEKPEATEPDVTTGQTEPTAPRETEPEKPAETEPDVTTGQTEPTVPRETESEKPPETEPIPGQTADTDSEEGTTAPVGIELPMMLEDGMLEVNSLLQSTAINPDCGNQEGSDIATIALKNNGSHMMEKATLIATLDDGTQIRFEASYLPAGKTAMVFSKDQISLPKDAVCVSLVCEAQWDRSAQTMPQGVSASADGMMVTVTNDTATDIPELIVYCRTPLGEAYFGGIVYEYKVTDLPANGSSTFMAIDCILGLAEVVKIAKP